YILCTVLGEEPQYYCVDIVKVSPKEKTKNLVIKITDEKLLDATGGIVQGMSGSPIIKDGKLVGALTHVMVDNVKCGYGIYAETMLETMSHL
ncbi:MAG: SpoIVB peptidase S55 domain-containing protein, partial [Ruminococcus sp.]